jgi:hypothetical protein
MSMAVRNVLAAAYFVKRNLVRGYFVRTCVGCIKKR